MNEPTSALTRVVSAVVLLVATTFAGAEEKRQPKVERIVEGDPVIRLLEPDAIPAIDNPEMVSASEADKFMKDDEPVLGVFDGTGARAYPTWMLDRHEIVNDRIGDVPIAATW